MTSVRALIATLETPISSPEARPSTTPWQKLPRRSAPEAKQRKARADRHRLERCSVAAE